MIEQISIDLSNYCSKGCPFCYNTSSKLGQTQWSPKEVICFAKSCIMAGTKSVSLGGGEPFEYNGIFDVISELYPLVYLTLTTNGLPLLDRDIVRRLDMTKPDKIHVSLHNADNNKEVERVKSQVRLLNDISIKPGVNLLIKASDLDSCKRAYLTLREELSNEQIILIPMRFGDTPTSRQLASITNGEPFQSPSCLLKCTKPNTFASISWDKKVNWCSYARGKQPLESLDYGGLMAALEKVDFTSCGSFCD
ncbi:MAG: radical SAM protein [Muribaculaceae bacterium]|nr:radical SAM protein [Muribaculaceae bacterium]